MQELISIDILKLVFKFSMLLQINETNVHQGLDMLGIPGKTSRKTLLSWNRFKLFFKIVLLFNLKHFERKLLNKSQVPYIQKQSSIGDPRDGLLN